MKRKINAFALAIFIAFAAVVPAGCSNDEIGTSETPTESGIFESESNNSSEDEVIKETETPIEISEKSAATESLNEEFRPEASSKNESSQLQSEISEKSSTQDTSPSEILKEQSSKADLSSL